LVSQDHLPRFAARDNREFTSGLAQTTACATIKSVSLQERNKATTLSDPSGGMPTRAAAKAADP